MCWSSVLRALTSGLFSPFSGHVEAVIFLTEICKVNPHMKDRWGFKHKLNFWILNWKWSPHIALFHLSDGATHLWMMPCSLAMTLLFQSCKTTSMSTLTASHRAMQRSRRPRWIHWRALCEPQWIMRVWSGNECIVLCTWEEWEDAERPDERMGLCDNKCIIWLCAVDWCISQ